MTQYPTTTNTHHMSEGVTVIQQSPSSQHSSVTRNNDHTHDDGTNIVRIDVDYKVARELSTLKAKFSELSFEVRQALEKVPLCKLEAVTKDLLEDDYTAQTLTYDALFDNIMDNSSCLDYLYLEDLIVTFLESTPLFTKFEKYSTEVEHFMNSETLGSLKKQVTGQIKAGKRIVQLKLGRRWKHVTIKQFKILKDMIFESKYLSQMTVNEGCLCVTWTTTNTTSAIVKNKAYDTEFMMAIGVLHVTVGNTVIYKTQQQDTSMTLDEAMIKTLESGPISAVELLLAVGANPNQQLPSGDTVISRAAKITDQYDSTVLYNASQNGHSEVVSILLRANADSSIAKNGWTTLMIASQNGHKDTVNLLIGAKSDVNVQANNGMTAIFIASENGHSEVVSILLKANADPSLAESDGWTPLMIASQNGYKDTVDLLIDAKADVNVQANDGMTAIFIASQNGHSEVVSILLKANADPSTAESDGWTPLMIASANGHKDTVDLLIDAKADVNVQNNNRVTALYITSQNGHSEVVSILLRANADPCIAKKNGGTPLMVASQNGHKETVDLLIDAKADVNVQTSDGATALYVASENGHSKVVSILLKANADPSIAMKNGWTPLMIASQNGHSEVVSILLRANADPCIAESDGWTPLMIASRNGRKDILDLLINAKADVNAQNNSGSTALHIACHYRHHKIISLLLEANAEPEIFRLDGWSPLMVASSVGDIGTVLLLHQYNADINYSTVTGETALSCASDDNVFQILLDCGSDINMLQSQQQPLWPLEQVRQQEQGQSRLYHYAIGESSFPDISHPLNTQEPKHVDNVPPSQNEECFFK